jgi:MOSC domain-containing protein YiiM
MGRIVAICMSTEKGTQKHCVAQAVLKQDFGLIGDAHAGPWHRQVSLLPLEKIEEFKRRGAQVEFGAFGENLVVDEIALRKLPVGTKLRCGDALLKVTQIGKQCHQGCLIFEQMGDCIMPREGIFAEVLCGGVIKQGDAVYVEQ